MLHLIQNDPEVPPGTIADTLNELGIFHLVHHPYLGAPLPEQRDVSAMIVLGGSMCANDDHGHPFLNDLKTAIRSCVSAGAPYLGICLGGQLLASALGAPVTANRWEECGTMPVALTDQGRSDPLFRNIADRFLTFQWHHDSFDLPHGAVLLASSPACPHQAFRFSRTAWGIQFHPEVTEQIIRDWCAWDPVTTGQTDTLTAEFLAHETFYRQTSRLMIENFVRSAGLLV